MGGRVLRIHHGMKAESTAPVFRRMIEDMQSIRKKGGMFKEASKLLVNSLYGRLGMGEKDFDTKIFNADQMAMYEDRISSYRRINNTIVAELTTSRRRQQTSNVALALITTSKARVKLYKGITDVSNGGGRMLYSDTDSIIASFRRDVTGERFGEVYFDPSEETTRLHRACFARPKTYSVKYSGGTTTKIKGFSRDIVSFEEFHKKFLEGDRVSDESAMQLSRKDFRLRRIFGMKEGSLSGYDKRTFDPTLTHTTPIKL